MAISRQILTEHQQQVLFVQEVKYQYRNHPTFIELLFFSTLNGAWLGGKSFSVWQKHKAEGAQKGVSDILYLQPRGDYNFLAIEMKRENRRNVKDGGLTEEEKEWLDVARNSGAYVAVCHSAEDALREFGFYMALPRR